MRIFVHNDITVERAVGVKAARTRVADVHRDHRLRSVSPPFGGEEGVNRSGAVHRLRSEVGVGIQRIAAIAAAAHVVLLEVSCRFREAGGVEEVVRAIHPVEKVRVDGVAVVGRRQVAGTKRKREAEVPVRGRCDFRCQEESGSQNVLPDDRVVAGGLIVLHPSPRRCRGVAGERLHRAIGERRSLGHQRARVGIRVGTLALKHESLGCLEERRCAFIENQAGRVIDDDIVDMRAVFVGDLKQPGELQLPANAEPDQAAFHVVSERSCCITHGASSGCWGNRIAVACEGFKPCRESRIDRLRRGAGGRQRIQGGRNTTGRTREKRASCVENPAVAVDVDGPRGVENFNAFELLAIHNVRYAVVRVGVLFGRIEAALVDTEDALRSELPSDLAGWPGTWFRQRTGRSNQMLIGGRFVLCRNAAQRDK